MPALSTNRLFTLFSMLYVTFLFTRCANVPSAPPSSQQMILRGEYLIHIGHCHDCHSPKIFSPDGSWVPEPIKLLSGHQAGTQLPAIDTSEITPGKWALGSSDFTAWVGPWGISYAANLTPDSITGLGAWTEENFIGAMRKGKHLGQDGGRPILPPMPWFDLKVMTDEDLKSVFAYLKSLKPIINQVPTPVPLTDIAGMGAVSQ